MFEDDYSWLPKMDKIIFVPGEKYLIKSGNNWETLIFLKFDPEHTLDGWGHNTESKSYEAYIFKNPDGYGSTTFGKEYLENLASDGLVKIYDENFNWKTDLKIKKISLNEKGLPILKTGFIILFENGIDIKETYPLQKKLFELGFKWYNKKNGELLKTSDIDSKIFTIECLNWKTSDKRYSGMDANQRDKKLLLISTYKNIDTEKDKERRLSIAYDHDVEVVDGYDLISKI